MHDKILAAKIVKEAEKHGEVEEITVEVGQLSGVAPDEMQKALESRVGWKVCTKQKEAVVRCVCGYEGPAKVILDENNNQSVKCPDCGGAPKVTEGNRVILMDVRLRGKKEGI